MSKNQVLAGHIEAEIHVPLTIFDSQGRAKDALVVMRAKVKSDGDRLSLHDMLVETATADLPESTIIEAIRNGWSRLTNESKQQKPLQQTCFAGI